MKLAFTFDERSQERLEDFVRQGRIDKDLREVVLVDPETKEQRTLLLPVPREIVTREKAEPPRMVVRPSS
jgi:hypothetical protein